jgi:hypothetical protein
MSGRNERRWRSRPATSSRPENGPHSGDVTLVETVSGSGQQEVEEAAVGRAVLLRPITDDDLDTVARFLHAHHDSKVPVESFRRSFAAHHSATRPNNGVMLIDGDEVVGVYLAYYSDRVVDGQVQRICNLGTWYVRPEYRRHSVRMAKAILTQEGFHFLDLSPTDTVAALNKRLGFEYLDDRAAVLPALPWPWRPEAISSDPLVIQQSLSAEELQLYNDHRDAPAARHVVLRDRDAVCYVVLRIVRRKKLPIAMVVYASHPETLRRMIRPFGGFALLRHRVVAVVVELRWLNGKILGGSIQRRLHPKMFRSPTLGPEDLDYFYSELLYLNW